MLALVAPGQGSQTPGMLSPWLELPGVPEQVAVFSAAAGLDLLRLGTTAGADEITDTAVTQPLVVALGLVAAAQLTPIAAGDALAVAGHSVGEVTAAAVAGVLEPRTAVAFAARRGAAMAAACALAPTGMSAVLGGDPDDVLAAIAGHGLVAANRNTAAQVVAAGPLAALAALAWDPPAGARVRPLAVAGAFHTDYMSTAQEVLATFVADVVAADPTVALLSNRDGAAVHSGVEALGRLVAQVTRPVRWDRCQDQLRALGVTALIELPPAGTLCGMAKRELPGVELLALRTPDDLDRARALLSATRSIVGAGATTARTHAATEN